MQKTGLKTFVYSFSVSLFAIFAANGVYLHAYRPDNRQIEIPSKNIILFLKDGAYNPSSKSAPIKKIALSVLPELKKEQAPPVMADSVVYAPEDNEVIMADSFIPLEVNNTFEEIVEYADSTTQQAVIVQSETRTEIIDNNTETVSPEYVVIPPKNAPVKIAEANDNPDFAAGRHLKYAEMTANQPQGLLLPLEKNSDLQFANKKIKIGKPENLNQVALADKTIPIQSMTKKNTPANEKKEWKQMNNRDVGDPWIVAKSAATVKNELLPQKEYYKNENADIKKAIAPSALNNNDNNVKIATETMKNLLIPIPEDILNEANLTPQLSYSSDKDKQSVKDVDPNTSENPSSEAEKTLPQTAKNGNILSSLNNIFNSSTKIKEDTKSDGKNNLLSELKEKLSPSQKNSIMPTEMRLSFQPNRAEISGQTLRWIQAFATRTAGDNSLALEIRIDGTSAMALQQKRLNLLHNILTNKGVEYSKINTVFTTREPNSFIIRTVQRNTEIKGAYPNNNTQAGKNYLQW